MCVWGGGGKICPGEAKLFTCPCPLKVQERPPRDLISGLGFRGRQELWGEVGGGRELLICPYPLEVQARPTREQRLALRSKV